MDHLVMMMRLFLGEHNTTRMSSLRLHLQPPATSSLPDSHKMEETFFLQKLKLLDSTMESWGRHWSRLPGRWGWVWSSCGGTGWWWREGGGRSETECLPEIADMDLNQDPLLPSPVLLAGPLSSHTLHQPFLDQTVTREVIKVDTRCMVHHSPGAAELISSPTREPPPSSLSSPSLQESQRTPEPSPFVQTKLVQIHP